MAGLEEMCRRLVAKKREIDEEREECAKLGAYSHLAEDYDEIARDIEEIARFLKMEPDNA